MTGPPLPPLGSATLDDVVHELQSVVSLMQKQTSATTANTSNAQQAQANNEATRRLAVLGAAASTVAHQLYSMAAAGVKFAETIGVSATQGIQLDLNNRRALLMQLRDIDLNRMATMQQIQAVEKSYVDTFLNVSEGMQLSAEGAQRLATNLKTGLGSEFQLSAQGMRALITVGASTTAEFENLRKASGRKALSDSQLANLTNKNSLSFMLYGPRFAKAAADAEKLGISLASVQSAQESMVTNLDGTIDTVAQINQLGGQVDFGTLTQLAETGGPEEVLRYLQSTIPPALFQSASTRALLKGFNVPIEDLMKSGDSAQARAARSFSDQLEEPTKEASRLSKAFAGLYAIVEKITGALKPLIVIFGAIAGALGFKSIISRMAQMGAGAAQSAAGVSGGRAPITNRARLLGPGPVSTPSLFQRMLSPFKPIGNENSFKLIRPTQPPAPTGFMGRINAAVKSPSTIGGASLAGVFGAIEGFITAKKEGKDTATSTGAATVQGSMAALGTVIGAGIVGWIPGIGLALAPIGAIVGGLLGNGIGKSINEKFPEFASIMGETFKSLVPAFTSIKEAGLELFTQLAGAGGSLIKALEPVTFILGLALTGAVMVLGKTLEGWLTILGWGIALIAGATAVVGFLFESLGKGLNWISSLVAKLPAWMRGGAAGPASPDTNTAPVARPGSSLASVNDVISRPGYGERTLTTPSGPVALNNKDTVVAYANDMVSSDASTRILSLGTLMRGAESSPTTTDPALIGKITDLITAISNANTTIEVGGQTQKVNRMQLVGVYSRNEIT